MKTLYKKDSKNKLRILNIWTENEFLVQESGLIEGKKTINKSLCKAKNIGKSNETTAFEQAIKEMHSKIEKKLTEGYFLTKEEAKNNVVMLPMLAYDYEKHKNKIDWSNCYVQPKMDGQRALGIQSQQTYKLISRQGKNIDTMEHILKDLNGVLHNLDGELYVHGHTFQDNMKLIKKYRKDETEKVKWHLYDVVLDEPYSVRKDILNSIYVKLESENKANNLVLVPTYKVNSYEEVLEHHSKFISDGYEGSILRHGNKKYKINGRCDSLLKLKNFIDITAELIDVIPEERRPNLGKALCKLTNDDGKIIEFPASFKATHEQRTEYLTNKHNYIGRTLEIRFFEWTDDGMPRHPVCYGFRNDK